MAWEWVTNKARKATELDAEYKSHSSLIDRLSELPPDTSYPEIERTWSTLDDRARAGFKMTLGALILKQQAIRTPAGKARLEKLVGLRNGIDRAAGATTATYAAPQTKSRSQLIGATRDRITALVDRAGAIPRGEMITALRRELDASRPQIEAKGAATWNALSARLNALAARAEAMANEPETRAALVAFRDAVIAALAAQAAESNPLAEARAALDACAGQPSPDLGALMTVGRSLRDARYEAGELTSDELERLSALDAEFAASESIVLERRRAAVQRRIAIEFVNAAAGHDAVTPSPSHDDRVESLMVGARALGSLGVSPSDLLQNMVDAALRQDREDGTLTAARQKSYSDLSASLMDATRITDVSALTDRCWELADELLTMTDDRPTEPVSTSEPPRTEDDTAKRLAWLDQYEQELEQAVEDGTMTPARAATYRAQLAEARSVMRMSQTTDGDKTLYRSRLRALLDRQLESMEHTASQTGGSRAQVLQRVTGNWQTLLLKERTKMATTAGEDEALDALGVRVIEARRIADELADDASAYELEVETLRRVASEVREFQRRHHLTLITPPWASPETRTEASGVFCAVGPDLLPTLKTLAAERRLKLLSAATSGKDPAQDAWDRLRAAAVAIFDLREHAPIESHEGLARAARVGEICYQLGIAYCLGVPAIIVTRAGQTIPFDVDLTPVELTGDQSSDLTSIGGAIDDALYSSQRFNAGDSVPATWDYFLQTFGHGAQAEENRAAVAEMRKEVQGDAIASAALIRYGLSLLRGNPPYLAYPALPGRYPDPEPRCFIVMPYRDHVDAGYRLVAKGCKKARVKAVRGDVTDDQQILRSIWDELGRCSYVTADLTDFNPNVCLELGIADTLGRQTILIGRPGTEKALFPSIAKRRVHIYTGEAADDQAIREALAQFLSGTPVPAVVPASPAPQPAAPPEPAAPPVEPVPTLSGLWSGMLRGDGETMETTVLISPAGRPTYCYHDSVGFEEVELTHRGQQIEYVPAGGGVITVRVLDVASSAGKCVHLISWSFERAAYGYMDQQYKRIAMQCELRGDKLAVTYAETGETYMSDTYPSDLSMMLGGSNTRQFTGLLEKERDP